MIAPSALERESQGIAIAGRAQQGRLQFAPDGAPIRALVAFCQDCGVVLASEPMEQGVDKEEAELRVAPPILGLLRDGAISLLCTAGCSTISARLCRHAKLPQVAVALITAPLPARG